MKNAKLFMDEGKDLRITYPELGQVPEFKTLTDKELRFVYMYACDSSPIKHLRPENRILQCLEILKDTLKGKQIDAYSKLEFPDKIKAAIDRMLRYDLSVRMNAREITEKFFKQIQEIAKTDVSKEDDIEKKKKYVDLVSSSIKILPSIVSQLENGFGVRFVEEDKKDEEEPARPLKWENVQGK